nr:hypothetical protein [uncultured Lichenicoccus sp.]
MHSNPWWLPDYFAGWLRPVAAIVALASSVAALALLLLPLVLVLLMVLFDITAHSVLVLVELMLGWLRAFMPGSPGVAAGAKFHPMGVALGSLLRALPVLAGLLVIAVGRQRRYWVGALLLWGLAASCDGAVVALLLGPAMAGAAISAIAPGLWASGRRPVRVDPGHSAMVPGERSGCEPGARDRPAGHPEGAPDRPGAQGDQQQRDP